MTSHRPPGQPALQHCSSNRPRATYGGMAGVGCMTEHLTAGIARQCRTTSADAARSPCDALPVWDSTPSAPNPTHGAR